MSKPNCKHVLEMDSAGVTAIKKIIPPNYHGDMEKGLLEDFFMGKQKRKATPTVEKKKKPNITRKEKQKCGYFKIPRDALKYEDVLPMHHMWLAYMAQLVGSSTTRVPNPRENKRWDIFTLQIYKSDFHGSLLKVVRSKCPSYVDKMGICIMDTKCTFKIISEDNIITTIPKKECVFEMHLKNLTIAIFGKHLCISPAGRSSKKFKFQLPFL